MLKLTKKEEKEFYQLLENYAYTKEAKQMKKYIQHGSITTFDHVVSVAALSFWMNRHFHLKADEQSLVVGAFLHDFYLYDWHIKDKAHSLHGWYHPTVALNNAKKRYTLNQREENIISSHMWPLTLRAVPTCKEAIVVCIADKWCSSYESVLRQKTLYSGLIN